MTLARERSVRSRIVVGQGPSKIGAAPYRLTCQEGRTAVDTALIVESPFLFGDRGGPRRLASPALKVKGAKGAKRTGSTLFTLFTSAVVSRQSCVVSR